MSVQRRATKQGIRWDVRLRDPEGRVYNRTFRTKREAQAFEATERAKRSRGEWFDPRGAMVPLAEVAQDWLSANPAKRPGTWARDEIALRCHIVPRLGARPVGSLTTADVQAAVNAWTETMAPRSVKRTYGVLRAVLNSAVERDLIVRTPCRGSIRLPAIEQTERELPDADQLEALADVLGPDYGVMVWLGAVLGLRWGEVAGLRVGRINALRSEVMVAEQRARGKGGVPVVGPPKSAAGRRTLHVPAPLMALLAEHLARRGLTGADTDAYVFVSPEGQPLDYSHWRRRIWQPAVTAVGLDGLTFHDLRRVNATALVDEGVDVKKAQVMLGHSDVRLTLEVYAQVVSESARAAADKVGARFLARDRRAMDLAQERGS